MGALPIQPGQHRPCAAIAAAPLRTLIVTATVAVGAAAWTGVAQAATTSPFPHEAKEAGRWSFLIAVVGLVVVLPLFLWLVELLVRLFSGHPKRVKPVVIGWIRGAIIGTDKRVSTSKTVAVIWTYTVASALLSLLIAKWWGHDHAYNAQVKIGLQSGYALLIGGPLGAAILAKGIVSSQVAAGTTSKVAAPAATASDLVNNDTGTTDLGDLQYVLFNTVALIFFFGEFLSAPQLALPTIPDVLLGLTSVSAAGYVGKKVLTSARAITKVDPSTITLSELGTPLPATITVHLYGAGLLNADGSAPTVNLVGATGTTPVSASSATASTTAQGLVLDAEFTTPLAAGDYEIDVVTKENIKVTLTNALKVSA